MAIDDHAEGLLRRHDRRRRWAVIPGATTCYATCHALFWKFSPSLLSFTSLGRLPDHQEDMTGLYPP